MSFSRTRHDVVRVVVDGDVVGSDRVEQLDVVLGRDPVFEADDHAVLLRVARHFLHHRDEGVDLRPGSSCRCGCRRGSAAGCCWCRGCGRSPPPRRAGSRRPDWCAAAAAICPAMPMASEQIWMPLSSAARLKAACVFGSRKRRRLAVGRDTARSPGCRRARSRARARSCVMSPRWPRFQSVIPTRTGTGLTVLCALRLRARRRALRRARIAGSERACATKSRRVIDIHGAS